MIDAAVTTRRVCSKHNPTECRKVHDSDQWWLGEGDSGGGGNVEEETETLEVCAWEERGDPLVVMKDGGRVEKGRPKREGVKELK